MSGTIIVRPRGFRVESNNYRVQQVVESFCYHTLTEMQYTKNAQTGQGTWTVKDEFYLHDTNSNTWYIHIAWYEELRTKLRACGMLNQMTVIIEDVNEGAPADFKRVSTFNFKDEQVAYHKFMTTIGENTRILPATMGAGKTILSASCCEDFGCRTVVFIEPKYRDTWRKEYKFLYNFEDEDRIRWVSGMDELRKLQQEALDGKLDVDVLLISLNTAESYFCNPDEWHTFPVHPWNFFNTLDIGYRIDDEAHSWLKFRCILDSFSSCAHHAYLTATLTEEYKFRKGIEDAVYPKVHRCKTIAPPKHVSLVATRYQFNRQNGIPQCCGAFGYQHHKLERYLLKRKWRAENYYTMVAEIIKRTWYETKDFKLGFKALVYFATTDMVKDFVKHAKLLMPDVEIGIAGAGTGDEAFKKFSVIAATPKKAGTGVDVPKLTKVYDTVMVNKTSENMQKFGRIREIKKYEHYELVIPMYVYFYSDDIKQHQQYHQKRYQLLGDLAISKEVKVWTKEI